MDLYRRADWHRFRERVFALDGYRCCRCGRGQAEGVVLQVHHKQYLPGRRPWDYPDHFCETICRGCHANIHGKIPPTFGWSLFSSDDLGDLIGTCEYCGTAIRHVFMVQHERWSILEVGTDCCDNLTRSTAARDHLQEVIALNRRRRTFIKSPRWKASSNGSQAIELRTSWRVRYHIKVVPEGGRYLVAVYDQRGKERHPSVEAAKSAVFDLPPDSSLRQVGQQLPEKARPPATLVIVDQGRGGRPLDGFNLHHVDWFIVMSR